MCLGPAGRDPALEDEEEEEEVGMDGVSDRGVEEHHCPERDNLAEFIVAALVICQSCLPIVVIVVVVVVFLFFSFLYFFFFPVRLLVCAGCSRPLPSSKHPTISGHGSLVSLVGGVHPGPLPAKRQ